MWILVKFISIHGTNFWVWQECCETGTGTETAAFCLNGTGNVMHFGSGSGFGPGSNIKCYTKVKKCRGQLLGNNTASSIEKARFCTNFLLLKNMLILRKCLSKKPLELQLYCVFMELTILKENSCTTILDRLRNRIHNSPKVWKNCEKTKSRKVTEQLFEAGN